MAQFKKLICFLATVCISGILSKYLKDSAQVHSVYHTEDFSAVPKKEPIQHLSNHELGNNRFPGRLQVENPSKPPCPDTINEPELRSGVEGACRHSVINTQELGIEYDQRNRFSHLKNHFVSEEKMISRVVDLRQISFSSSKSNVDKIPRPINSVAQEDNISKELNPVSSIGQPPREISSHTLIKRFNQHKKKDASKEITEKNNDICGYKLAPGSPKLKHYIVFEAKRFARLAGAAYLEYDELKNWNCAHCVKAGKYELLKMIDIPALKLRCIILVDHRRRDLVISFRGSKGIDQIKELISIRKTTYKLFKHAKVQIKLQERTDAIFKEIARYLKPRIKHYRCYRKVLVGHSLGGAMAVLTAPFLRRRFFIQISHIAVYTYGQPRVGDETFAKWYNKKKIHTIRVVNGRDPIPHTPQLIFGYSHTHRELFLEDSDTLCSNSTLEDDQCSNKYWFNIALPRTHRSVWDIEI